MKFNPLPAILASAVLAVIMAFTLREPGQKVPKSELKDKPLKICVISDLNSSYGSTTYSDDVKAVISQLSVIKPDIILCGGDMVAGQKASLTDENITQMWSSFKNTVLDPISSLQIPFGFTVGNHDASPSYARDRSFSEKFWKDNIQSTHLTFVESANYPFYYSYVKNNVFFMSWDAAGAEIRPEVYEWMQTQLKSKVAKKARMRILIGHLPLYAIVDSKNKPGEVNADPEAALKFFTANGIDLYISGHQHAYYPAEKNGVQFLNMGCIGDGPRKLIGNDAAAQKSYTVFEIPVKKQARLRYDAFKPVSNEIIDISYLPDSVNGFNGVSRKLTP